MEKRLAPGKPMISRRKAIVHARKLPIPKESPQAPSPVTSTPSTQSTLADDYPSDIPVVPHTQAEEDMRKLMNEYYRPEAYPVDHMPRVMAYCDRYRKEAIDLVLEEGFAESNPLHLRELRGAMKLIQDQLVRMNWINVHDRDVVSTLLIHATVNVRSIRDIVPRFQYDSICHNRELTGICLQVLHMLRSFRVPDPGAPSATPTILCAMYEGKRTFPYLSEVYLVLAAAFTNACIFNDDRALTDYWRLFFEAARTIFRHRYAGSHELVHEDDVVGYRKLYWYYTVDMLAFNMNPRIQQTEEDIHLEQLAVIGAQEELVVDPLF